MTTQDWAPPSSGLSDYAVSPLGMPRALLNDEVRVAFLARTSTEDQQDPRQSIIRQLTNSKNALPETWVITAHFYDVESGRLELDERGRKQGYERFDIPIPRAGGSTDLLDEASRPNRRFDVVICENISRVARRAFEGLSVERELERVDVPLFASNEPLTLTGSRAQRVLQRRINQSIAEYEVLNTLEQSWGGLCTHVRDGWNIGQPPYGYKAKIIPHPSPVKAEKGKTKSRLEPDGLRGQAVTQMAHWRYYERLGCTTIAQRLNADLERYPPPEAPCRARTRGNWTRSSVYNILCNPKYTGYQVFNRRATTSKRGRVNEPYKWVWSPKPAHEPLVEKWMFDEINGGRARNRGSRDGDTLNTYPSAKRKYILRGRVLHNCGRRMVGDKRGRGAAYYLCWPGKNNEGKPNLHPGLPTSVRVREDELLEAVCRFYADRLFSPERRSILEGDLGAVDDSATRERDAERQRQRKLLATIARQQESILR
jgi:site-specific DNA recombinase